MSSQVTVQLRGRVYSGHYKVAEHFITVWCGARSKTTPRRGMRPKPIARMLLRQMAREQQPDPAFGW